jgi:hypothetical protein
LEIGSLQISKEANYRLARLSIAGNSLCILHHYYLGFMGHSSTFLLSSIFYLNFSRGRPDHILCLNAGSNHPLLSWGFCSPHHSSLSIFSPILGITAGLPASIPHWLGLPRTHLPLLSGSPDLLLCHLGFMVSLSFTL